MTKLIVVNVVRGAGATYVPLSRDHWVPCGRCDCPKCKGNEGYWDTLVVPDAGNGDTTFMVHWPELQERKLT